MNLLYTILDTDEVSYSIYGFWGAVHRRLADFIPYKIQHWWTNHVRTLYNPQHSNLRRAIPKTWCDIDGCVEAFLFACVIDFVEGEEGLADWEGQDLYWGPPWPEGSINPRKQQAAMLREVYNWAKTGRQAAESAMFASAPKHPPKVTITERLAGDYTEWRRIEDEMEVKTHRYLLWIVENRRLMWT